MVFVKGARPVPRYMIPHRDLVELFNHMPDVMERLVKNAANAYRE